ncbi:hypothetical protein [Pseudarthrobacter sp. NIBRBAC000502770]|uniref:hypothetical protein n=1 Tax=Pseudarthrobacter sp. NIBRBAC000502770 TaxID=2590785 RepID=UPI00113FF694|nr:hypothetical protein [Pseudarthrobacter sp. NIBRBAC000502770]QDG90695.1 hypothetical protein NIBR502770_20955 [Pseudarthrobacter sp. NIBRBAC000502770]
MSRLRDLKRAFGRLTRVDWAFLHFKAALGIMLMLPLTQLGSVKNTVTLWFIVVWLIVTWLGFGVSVVGLVLSAQQHETRRTGFRVEMTGLCLMLAGPLVFIGVQAGIWIDTGQDKGVAIALCYVIASAIVARMVMIKTAAKSRTVIYRYLEKKEGPGD